MAKLISPPSINSVEGLLDLLLDTKKYARYLQQLKDLRDEIVKLLDLYMDKSYVESALSDVIEKQKHTKQELMALEKRVAEFEELKEDELRKLASSKLELSREREDFQHTAEQLKKDYASRQQGLVVWNGELEKKAKQLEEWAAKVAVRESTVAVKESELEAWLSRVPKK